MMEVVRGDISFSPEFKGKLRGGYYSPVHVVDVERLENGIWVAKKAVMKQWGKAPDVDDDCGSFHSLEEIQLVIEDMEWLKRIVATSGVKVPSMYFWEVVDEKLTWYQAIQSLAKTDRTLPPSGFRVVELEEHSGTVLRDLTPDHKKNAIELARKALALIPEGIAIDAHPGNFTWDGENITYVDFVPPKVWEYRGVGRMEEIFPTIRKREDDEKKKYYYLTSKGRLERYDYYVSRFG